MPISTPRPTSYPGIERIVAVSSAKGGVGKSTVTVNLALALQQMGKRVGILDADILGPSIPGMLGIDTSSKPSQTENRKVEPPVGHGIKTVSMAMFSDDDQPVMLRGPMVGKYLSQFLAGTEWGELDVLLLDMPPGTGDVQLTIAQSFPIDGAVVVTTPQAVSTKIARRGARMFEAVQTPILGVVENMHDYTCPDCGAKSALFGHGGGADLAALLGVPMLGTLPLDPAMIDAGDEGMPLLAANRESTTTEAYRAVAANLDKALVRRSTTLGPFRWKLADKATAPGWNEDAVLENGAREVPVGIRAGDTRTLEFMWQDGARQLVDIRDLRLSCGCALCRDEMTGRPLVDPAKVPHDIHPIEIRNVGTYAIGIAWSDGHSSGIHPFATIRGRADADDRRDALKA